MKTIAALLCVLLAAVTVEAATCNCQSTGICVCPAGQCQCPNCPGNVNARRIVVQSPVYQTAAVYPVARVYAVPVYQAAPMVQFYQAPTNFYQSGQCVWTGNGWDCSGTQRQYMSGSERRAVRRLQRRGYQIFYE